VDPKDRYERTLAYLTQEGAMHNLALVAEGYARVLTIPPNDKYADRFPAGTARGAI
jgi:micrococcal nuclease